ncbi:MAG: dicarboxylate/amino acid:cation symporter [Vicinamibacterales bacterium]
MRNVLRSLYAQVLIAIAIGVALGALYPDLAKQMKPLGDGFIKLVKMVIGPIIFCTVVTGIASMGDLKKVGRVGIKALLYFEVVTTLALVIGLLMVNAIKPGAGMNADPARLDTASITTYQQTAEKSQTVTQFVLNIIPTSVVGALAGDEVLPILFVAVLCGFALTSMGERGRPLVASIERISSMLFGIVGVIMRVAPIGAFGAMAFSVGAFGFGTLTGLALLMGTFYATCLLFIFVVLGIIARVHGFSIVSFLRYIREELLIVLGTSSSEAALPRLMAKLERAGCAKAVVGLVVPTGYSFNLDGTSIYLTMTAIFIAQATNTPLTVMQQVGVLAVLLLTSKGAAGVVGAGFVTLAATLGTVGHIPIEGLALVLGIDRFMSEARAITNLIGNGVATVVVSKWEGELDEEALRRQLDPRSAPA